MRFGSLKIVDPLVALLAFGIFLSGFNGIRVAPNVALGDVFLAVTAAAWIAAAPLKSHIRLNWVLALSWGLLVVALAVQLLMGQPLLGNNRDIATFIKVTGALYLLPYIVVDILRSRRWLEIVLLSYISACLLNVLFSISDLAGATDFSFLLDVSTVGDWEYVGRFHGLTVHPNHMGQHSAIGAMLLTAFWPKALRARLIWLVPFVLLLVGVVGSGSRGALLALGVSAAVLAIGHVRSAVRRPGWTATGIVIVVAVCLAGAIMLEHSGVLLMDVAFERVFSGGGSAYASDIARLYKYRLAFRDFVQQPVYGAGFGFIGGVENVYLQFLQAAGLIGLLSLLIYLFFPLLHVLRLLNIGHDKALQACALSVVVFAVGALTQNMIYVRFSILPLGFVWAAIFIVTRDRKLRREA